MKQSKPKYEYTKKYDVAQLDAMRQRWQELNVLDEQVIDGKKDTHLFWYFLRHDAGQKLTLLDIAEHFGVTEQYISQVVKRVEKSIKGVKSK